MVTEFPLSPNLEFAILASDGIWDHLSNETVATLVAEASSGGPSVEAGAANSAMVACAKVLDHIQEGQAAGSLDPKMVDDRGIVVVVMRTVS